MPYPDLQLPRVKMDTAQYHEVQREQSERIISSGREHLLRQALEFYAGGGADDGQKAKAVLEISK